MHPCARALAQATSSHNLCNRPLIVFTLLAAPAFIPYALVLSGLYQQETGHRMLWFMQHSLLARGVGFNALFTFVWFILGSVWLFSSESNCRWGLHMRGTPLPRPSPALTPALHGLPAV